MSGVSRRRRDEQLAVREERGLDSEGNGQNSFFWTKEDIGVMNVFFRDMWRNKP